MQSAFDVLTFFEVHLQAAKNGHARYAQAGIDETIAPARIIPSMSPQILDGIRVLDLATGMAAPEPVVVIKQREYGS